MKVLIDKYPMGSFPGQKSPGRYFDGILYDNLKGMAEVITRDMTFLGILSSSTLENGTGKSTLATQMGEVWTALMKDVHNITIPFDMKHVVFNPEQLIDRAFKVPKYSMIMLDEWEDQHYWSKLGMSLRQFFRKCRQLNLFILIIIPNFFQLPINYAISRSVFFIDVRFEGKFERGYFRFYDFNKKKDLFLNGKKTQNYSIVEPNFQGRFTDGYGVDEKEYRAAKLKDMIDTDKDEEEKLDERSMRRKIMVDIVNKIHESIPEIPVYRIANALKLHRKTIFTYLREGGSCNGDTEVQDINYLNQDDQSETDQPKAVIPIINKQQAD